MRVALVHATIGLFREGLVAILAQEHVSELLHIVHFEIFVIAVMVVGIRVVFGIIVQSVRIDHHYDVVFFVSRVQTDFVELRTVFQLFRR